MSSVPRVTVVTVYYNRANYVASSIQSLLDQTLQDIAIIVVDDGSTDGTLAALKSFDDPRLTVISKPNSGFTDSIIMAVEQAKSEYVAVHGSGDISLPDRLRAQAEFLDRNPNVAVVGCWVENVTAAGTAEARYRVDERLSFKQALQLTSVFTHGEVMYRKSVYDDVGGYRTFFKYSQDYDLWFRMSADHEFGVVPAVLYRRMSPPDTIRLDPKKMLAQFNLSEIALQSARLREAGQRDLIDEHEHLAFAYLAKSPMFGDHLVGVGTHMIVRVGNPDGRLLITQGLMHSPSVRNFLKSAVAYGYLRSPLFRRVCRIALNYRRGKGGLPRLEH